MKPRDNIQAAHADAPSETDWGAGKLVRLGWFLLLLSLFAYVGYCGGNLALWDEWQNIPGLLGRVPLGHWLWERMSEHRVPCARLILLILAWLTNYDFRAGMVVSVILLGTLALLLARTAHRLRGGTSYADLFFPLVLLNIGHEYNLLQGWNLQNTLFTFSAGLALILLTSLWSRRNALLFAFVVMLLPWNGGSGLILACVLAVWIAIAAMFPRISSFNKAGHRLAAIALALVVALEGWAYLRGIPPRTPAAATPQTTLRGTLQVLSMAFGPATDTLWPASGIACAVVLVAGLLLAARRWWRWPADRLRTFALIGFVLAFFAIAGAVAYGRSGLGGDACFQSRYALLMVPAFCAVYLIACIGEPHRAGRLLQFVMLMFAVAAFPLDTQDGLRVGLDHRLGLQAVERDIRAGIPSLWLLNRNPWLIPTWDSNHAPLSGMLIADRQLDLLRQARIGTYRYLAEPMPTMEVPIAIAPSELHDMEWRDGVAYGHSTDSWMRIPIHERRKVYAVLIDCSLFDGTRDSERANFTVWWQSTTAGEIHESMEQRRVPKLSEDRIVPIWVNDHISQIRIQPDRKLCVCRIKQITLLVPSSERAD